ncbi:hypothetical protein GWI33_004630 [Rhynchophorus ferrugineus]|uniref:Uncharacterized protein n=1 Tax=Rhynchophorus ferrugineus TaxID=354439 RepID=A0A834MMX2_RHYFE|nr:hypothetical protein GWI33_004630 [Rhynchophorus ferrugineus]
MSRNFALCPRRASERARKTRNPFTSRAKIKNGENKIDVPAILAKYFASLHFIVTRRGPARFSTGESVSGRDRRSKYGWASATCVPQRKIMPQLWKTEKIKLKARRHGEDGRVQYTPLII